MTVRFHVDCHVDATLNDRYYASAILYSREYYLKAIFDSLLTLHTVIEQWHIDPSSIPDYSSMSSDLAKMWSDINAMEWSKYSDIMVANGDQLKELLVTKGVEGAVEALVETYLRKCGGNRQGPSSVVILLYTLTYRSQDDVQFIMPNTIQECLDYLELPPVSQCFSLNQEHVEMEPFYKMYLFFFRMKLDL